MSSLAQIAALLAIIGGAAATWPIITSAVTASSGTRARRRYVEQLGRRDGTVRAMLLGLRGPDPAIRDKDGSEQRVTLSGAILSIAAVTILFGYATTGVVALFMMGVYFEWIWKRVRVGTVSWLELHDSFKDVPREVWASYRLARVGTVLGPSTWTGLGVVVYWTALTGIPRTNLSLADPAVVLVTTGVLLGIVLWAAVSARSRFSEVTFYEEVTYRRLVRGGSPAAQVRVYTRGLRFPERPAVSAAVDSLGDVLTTESGIPPEADEFLWTEIDHLAVVPPRTVAV